jgi:hypothetical protein
MVAEHKGGIAASASGPYASIARAREIGFRGESMKPELKYALCALSFYAVRHEKVAQFKSGQRKFKLVSRYEQNVATARRYIRRARKLGFHGSIREQVAKCYLKQG